MTYTIVQGVRTHGDAQGIVGNVGTTLGLVASIYQFFITGAEENFSNEMMHMGSPTPAPENMKKVAVATGVDFVSWVLQIAGMSIRARDMHE